MKSNQTLYYDQTNSGNRPLRILASLYSYTCSLELTIDCERKWCHFCLNDICGSKANNREKFLISFVIQLFIGEK